MKPVIRESKLEGLGAFAHKSYKPGKRWVFPLQKVCCDGHSYVHMEVGGSTVYLGTTDWPYYVNSTWPDTSKSNCDVIIDTDNMSITIVVEKFIKRGQELTIPYDWTIHTTCTERNEHGMDS